MCEVQRALANRKREEKKRKSQLRTFSSMKGIEFPSAIADINPLILLAAATVLLTSHPDTNSSRIMAVTRLIG